MDRMVHDLSPVFKSKCKESVPEAESLQAALGLLLKAGSQTDINVDSRADGYSAAVPAMKFLQAQGLQPHHL